MKTTIKRRLCALCISMLYVLAAGHPVLAEDIEVLIGPGGQAGATPNVLFIMDTSGSMTKNIAGDTISLITEHAGRSRISRMEIVRGVLTELMANSIGINVALMRFNSTGDGGHFITPMQILNTSTRENLVTAARELTAERETLTPLAETLYEAARFWRGMTVDYGSTNNVAGVSSDERYISPITSQCQKNYTILLTDGLPSADNQADEDISRYFLNNDAVCTNNCLDEIAGYLNTADQSTGIDGIPGTQTIETYIIGFTLPEPNLLNPDHDLLQRTARAGGGRYFPANDAATLSDAFAAILENITITDTNNSFSPPALAANTFNGIAHFNRLYYALFEPATTPGWNGNIKPYALNDNNELTDAEGNVAVDARGFFRATSRSFWSANANGDNIIEGGANSRFPPDVNDRNLYTYTGDANTDPGPSSRSNFALDALSNNNNSNLTAAMLGLSNADANTLNTEFNSVLDSIRNARLGAPLHSQPALVTYGGTNADDAILTLFVATNDGFLHALDASLDTEDTEGGKELFAFIPKELLPRLPELDNNTGPIVYGLDGNISVWVQESNDADHNIESGDDDHVYVYVGMRRGGNNYYALDVTNRETPSLKWVIRGGLDGTPGFEELGQSWSKATLTSIKYGSGIRKVLIFGGGYDTAQDDNPLNADDSIGRAIFIVDADTGERLWWAGPDDVDNDADLKLPTLTNSIPSEIRLFDSNHDGYTDRLYVGDMRGQIFRFDLRASGSGVTGTGIRLANLGGTIEADNRRFYYPPDVVLTQRRGTAPYLSINIGSGYRAHPLNPLTADSLPAERVDDRFYSLRDPNIFDVASDDFVTITNGNSLFDATSTLVTSPTDIDTFNGWYITLGAGSGEKVLAPSVTINGEISFTTYTPPASVTRGQCESPSPGVGRLYRVSLFDATPVRNTAGTGDSDPSTPTLEDRAETLQRPGIPPGPAIIFRDRTRQCAGTGCNNPRDDDPPGSPPGDPRAESLSSSITGCVNTRCDDIANPDPIQKTYWQDRP